MTNEEARTAESIWTKPIDLPLWLTRAVAIVSRAVFISGLLLVGTVLALWLHNRLTLGPGARIEVADSVSIRVPQHFVARTYHDDGPNPVLKTYLLHDQRVEFGGLVVVEALKPGQRLSFRDPAFMAEYHREVGDELRGPAVFRHSGLDVTATVQPTKPRATHEGRYMLTALIDVDGQLIYLMGDNVSLGVGEQTGAQAMAIAAIEMLQLTGK